MRGMRSDLWADRPDPDPSWRLQALCRGADPDIWFPARGDKDTYRRALATCQLCPVREACLEYALEANEREGVWGGVSTKERERMRRARGMTRRHGHACRCPSCTLKAAREAS